MGDPRPMDRRQQRTRTAIQNAFVELALKRRYDDFGVHELVELAGVGRSTFYDHYRNKDDVLREMMDAMLAELADAAAGRSRPGTLRGLLEHFWDNRRLGKTVFGAPLGMTIKRQLAEHVEAALDGGKPAAGRANRARAAFIAAGQVGLLHSWLSGELSADAEEIAVTLTAGG